MTKRIYKTMQGREIDMDSLLAKNETMPAVGNVRMNARGDELGAGGKIVRTREEVVSEYYEDNPNAQPKQAKAPVVEKVIVPEAKKTNVKTQS
jgi:hypothetical protein